MSKPVSKPGSEPAPPAEAAESKDGNAEPTQSAEDGGDETRRRFREALERKQQSNHATAQGAAQDGSDKSHGTTGPTKARQFRRKSI